mmetsp:Transcript_15038/g.20619  ORF Transcript_15038/g.20619 Transcript_15038/m.20619 type:complete len:243 (-) Transcript_15038:253-981(-)
MLCSTGSKVPCNNSIASSSGASLSPSRLMLVEMPLQSRSSSRCSETEWCCRGLPGASTSRVSSDRSSELCHSSSSLSMLSFRRFSNRHTACCSKTCSTPLQPGCGSLCSCDNTSRHLQAWALSSGRERLISRNLSTVRREVCSEVMRPVVTKWASTTALDLPFTAANTVHNDCMAATCKLGESGLIMKGSVRVDTNSAKCGVTSCGRAPSRSARNISITAMRVSESTPNCTTSTSPRKRGRM